MCIAIHSFIALIGLGFEVVIDSITSTTAKIFLSCHDLSFVALMVFQNNASVLWSNDVPCNSTKDLGLLQPNTQYSISANYRETLICPFQTEEGKKDFS